MDRRPLRVGLVFLFAALAVAAMLLTGCGGGGDDRTKVEASLRHYLYSLSAGTMFEQPGILPTERIPTRSRRPAGQGEQLQEG